MNFFFFSPFVSLFKFKTDFKTCLKRGLFYFCFFSFLLYSEEAASKATSLTLRLKSHIKVYSHSPFVSFEDLLDQEEIEKRKSLGDFSFSEISSQILSQSQSSLSSWDSFLVLRNPLLMKKKILTQKEIVNLLEKEFGQNENYFQLEHKNGQLGKRIVGVKNDSKINDFFFEKRFFYQEKSQEKFQKKQLEKEILNFDHREFNFGKKVSERVIGKAPENRNEKQKKGLNLLISLPEKIIIEKRQYEVSKDSIKRILMRDWKKICKDCEFVLRSLVIPSISKDLLKGRAWKISHHLGLPKGNFSLPLVFEENLENPEKSLSSNLKRNLKTSSFDSSNNKISKLQKDRLKKKVRSWNRGRTFWVNGRLDIYKKVPVMNRSFSRLERLEREDFNFSYRKVSFFSRRQVPSKKELLRQKLRRSLRAGDIIWRSLIAKEKALQKGDTVEIKLKERNWQVTLIGQSKQDGFIGDRVKVLNLDSKKIITALVVDKGKVLVE